VPYESFPRSARDNQSQAAKRMAARRAAVTGQPGQIAFRGAAQAFAVIVLLTQDLDVHACSAVAGMAPFGPVQG
jgi:hypothetical protein